MLRVGIVGTGEIANLNILGYLNSMDTEIVAVCDIDTKKAKNKLEQWNLRNTKIYADYKNMIDKEDLDIVEILTPQHLHLPMTEYCANSNISGISVKIPLADTITNCNKMIDICNDNQVKLKLYENFRFSPVNLKAKELLKQNLIGEPLNFSINTILVGKQDRKRKNKSPTQFSKIKTYEWDSMIYNDGIHKFSMALWLMEKEKVEKAYSWIDEFATSTIGPSITFWKYPSKKDNNPPKYGSMQYSIASNLNYPSNYHDWDEFIEISGTKGMMWINQCTSGGNFLSKSPQFPPIVIYIDGKVKTYGEDLPRDLRYSFINSTEDFIDVIKTGKGKPVYTGKQGKNLSIFAKMPYMSQQKKRPIYWEDITSKDEVNEIDN